MSYGQFPMHNMAANAQCLPNVSQLLHMNAAGSPQVAQNASLQEMLMREQMNQMAYGMSPVQGMFASPMNMTAMNGVFLPQQMNAQTQYPRMQKQFGNNTLFTGASLTPPSKTNKLGPRSPLGELPSNNNDMQVDPIKALLDREKQQRQNIQKLEITESARLEMNLQNTNIKKNSQKPADTAFPATPQQGHGEDARCPKTCEREENTDGTVKYNFETGLPGGLCMYYMKGFCGLGKRCRYVHDATDEGCIVKITGMPYTVQVNDILKFFAPIQVLPENVQFIISKEGKQSGSAFVEFNSRPDAIFALNKDREYISPQRFVLLYPSSKIERKWFKENPLPFSAHATPASNRNRSEQPSSRVHSNRNNNESANVTTPLPQHASPAFSANMSNPVTLTPQGTNAANVNVNQQAALLSQQIQQMQLLTNAVNALSPQASSTAFVQPQVAPLSSMNLLAPFATTLGGSPMSMMPQVQPNVPVLPQSTTLASNDDNRTPVKQLSFDETDEPSANKQSDAAMQDLVKKLLNPVTLSNIPDDTLSVVLKSVGYSDDASRGMIKQIKGNQAPRQGYNTLPPLVPMNPTKTA